MGLGIFLSKLILKFSNCAHIEASKSIMEAPILGVRLHLASSTKKMDKLVVGSKSKSVVPLKTPLPFLLIKTGLYMLGDVHVAHYVLTIWLFRQLLQFLIVQLDETLIERINFLFDLKYRD